MAGPATKYKFDGIGSASAKLVMALLVANGQVWAAGGFWANIVSFILTKVFSMGASVGLVLMNVGAEKVEGLVEQHDYDGSWDSAEKLLNAARDAHQTLTPEQIQAIDAPVINTFRKFATLAKATQQGFMRISACAFMLLALLFAIAFATGCSTTTTIPTIHPTITLPASGDGYWVSTVATPQGPNEGRIPKEQWDIQRKRTIDLTSDDWKILRDFLLKNCLTNACKYMVGTFDDLFNAIDQALSKMPSIPLPGKK